MTALFILKLLLAPSLVALASLAGRRWGLKVGGAIAGFPVVVGPTLLFFALEQGSDFAAAAARKTLWSVLPYGVFCLVMSWACRKVPLWLSLLLAWVAYVLVAWSGASGRESFAELMLIALLSAVAARWALPRVHTDQAVPLVPGRFDMPLRMSATLALLLSVTAAAKAMGPDWSGVMAAFPIASSILGVFSSLSNGKDGPALLFRGSLLGSYSYIAFSAALILALPRWGLGLGFATATASAVAVQIGALFLSGRRN
jgi:hypothetical protein